MNYLLSLPFFIFALLISVLAIYVIIRTTKERDLSEDRLARWRSAWEEHRRWLSEFPDVATALDHMQARAEGHGGTDISRTRDEMRQRRDKTTITLSPSEIQSGHDRVYWAEGLIRQLPEEHDGRNSWLLNHARDRTPL